MGRPKIKKSDQHRNAVQVNLTDKQYSWMETAANVRGFSNKSVFFRALLEREMLEEKKNIHLRFMGPYVISEEKL